MTDHVQAPIQTLNFSAGVSWRRTGALRWAVPAYAIAPHGAVLQEEWQSEYGGREWRTIPTVVVPSEEFARARA